MEDLKAPKDKTELIKIIDKFRANPEGKVTDYQLFIHIIANSLAYGRPFKKAVENGFIHMQSPNNARKLFLNKRR